MTLKIGSVPYLNAKPLVDWFHSAECDVDAEVIYEVPSKLAVMLRNGEVDVCNCSIFESLSSPGLTVLPGISISSDGPVMSVRLFTKCNVSELQSVALDTSSLTSAALTRIILSEAYGVSPHYVHFAPDLDSMLSECDAGLIIGDLKLFDLHEGTSEIDLGAEWKRLCGKPFVYAAWQAPVEKANADVVTALERARDWGVSRLPELSEFWSAQMNLPVARCLDYFTSAMIYSLTAEQLEGLSVFQSLCFKHGLIKSSEPVSVWQSNL